MLWGENKRKWKGLQPPGVEPRTPLAWAASPLPLSDDSRTTCVRLPVAAGLFTSSLYFHLITSELIYFQCEACVYMCVCVCVHVFYLVEGHIAHSIWSLCHNSEQLSYRCFMELGVLLLPNYLMFEQSPLSPATPMDAAVCLTLLISTLYGSEILCVCDLW